MKHLAQQLLQKASIIMVTSIWGTKAHQEKYLVMSLTESLCSK